MFEKFLKVSSFYGKGTDRKFALLVHFCILLKMQSCGKTSAIGLYIKIKALFPLPFPRKTRLLFALFGYFWQEIWRGHKSKGKNQNVTYPISPRRFLVNFLYIFEKKKKWVRFADAEFNAEAIGTNSKSQKWKTKQLVRPFLIALFQDNCG